MWICGLSYLRLQLVYSNNNIGSAGRKGGFRSIRFWGIPPPLEGGREISLKMHENVSNFKNFSFLRSRKNFSRLRRKIF